MRISVYITSYNQKEFLKEAIQSVLEQTLKPYEIIIVDDCSTDGSQLIIEDYQRKYPKLIRKHFNSVNVGITKTRNVALSLVKGDFLTWLDGDDIFLKNKLEIEVDLIKTTKADFVYSNFYYSKDDIENVYQIWCSEKNQLPKTQEVFKEVISRSFPRRTLYRYELVDMKFLTTIDGYDENLEIYEDFDFRIRLSENAKTAFSLQPLSVYRMHSNGLSRANEEVHRRNLNHIYTKCEKSVLSFKDKEREKVRTEILKFTDKYSIKRNKDSKILSVKNRVKNKLIRIIKRL